MSVWSTLGQMVQGTLEQALGDDEGNEKNENVNTIEDTPPPSDDISTDTSFKGNDEQVSNLRDKLKDMETQNQLLNAEYAKLLREKEEELIKLRGQHTSVEGEEESMKLRRLLEEKEIEVKEINSKAEAKFNKLKAQAKSKIAKLQEELQAVREDSSVGVANVSQESLNLSVQSVHDSDELPKLQEKVASLQEIAADKEATIIDIKRTLSLREKELEEKKMELCNQEEEGRRLQENIMKMSQELRVAEDQIKEHSAAITDRESEITELNCTIRNQSDNIEQNNSLQAQLKMDMEKEKEEKIKLSQQIAELLHKMDDEKRMTRDLSFASSEFQVVSQVPSDSEEEWKIIRTSESGSGSSEGKETSPPPEMLSITREESPLTKQSQLMPPHDIHATNKQKVLITEMENTLASKETEINLLKSQIAESTERLSVANEKISSLEKELETNQWDRVETSWGFDEIDGRSEEVEKLKETIANLTSEMERIGEERIEACNSLQLKSNELLQISQEKNKQIIIIEEFRKEMITKTTEFDNEISQMSNLIDTLKQELEDKKNLIGQLEKEKAELVSNQLQVSGVLEGKDEVNQKMLKMEEELRNSCEEKKSLELVLKKKEEEMEDMAKEEEVLLKKKDVLIDSLCKEKQDLEKLAEKREKECDKVVKEKDDELKCSLSDKDIVIQKLLDEKLHLSQEIETRNSELRALEELKEREKNEQKHLREEMKRLSSSNQTFSSDSAKCREEVMSMEAQIDNLKRERNQLASELDVSKESVRNLEKQVRNDKRKGAEIEEELKKYTQETGRLKNQFDSAVELLQQENAQLKSDLGTSKRECSQRVSVCEVLQEQVKSESKRSMELKDINRTLTQEIKGLNERCTGLERERSSLNHQLLQLTREHEQLQISLETSISDREALTQETNSTRKSNEVYENHVMELTNQIAMLVHEKDTADDNVRRLQREMVVKEKHEIELKEKLQLIHKEAVGQSEWMEERQSLLDSQSQLQSELYIANQETKDREITIESLNKSTEELQVQCKTLQNALMAAKGLMSESTKSESGRITELEKRVTDIRYTHKLELSNIQTSLKEEQQRRATVEDNLLKLQQQQQQQHGGHDITIIDMDNTSLEEEGPTKGMVADNKVGVSDNFAAVKKWIQRFVKNPNIVLVRLVRATPQTQLFFIAYLVLIHLILLYMLLT